MRARSFARHFVWGLLSAIAGFGILSGAVNATELVAADVTPLNAVANQHLPVAAASLAPAKHLAASGASLPAAKILGPASAATNARPTASVPAAVNPPESAGKHSASDLLLLIVVGVSLVAYQLLRKHRLLRPQPFSL